MSLSEEEVARVTSLRLTPCWWTLGLGLPALIATVVIGATVTTEGGEELIQHPLMIGLLGSELLGFACSLLYWTDEWAELNRRPKAWMVKQFPDSWPLFPLSTPERIEHNRNLVRIMGFGCVWIGGALVIGAALKAVGAAS